jgi:hypothetical protein
MLVRIDPVKVEDCMSIEWFPDGERFVYGQGNGTLGICVWCSIQG